MDLPSLKHTTVIGIGHRARQGKDTAAKALESIGAGRVRRFAFSDGISAYCRIRYQMTHRDPPKLQFVGSAERRHDENVWVRCVAWSIADWDQDAEGPQVAVIAGVRFPNEAAMVTELGGQLLRIQRFTKSGAPYVPTDRDPKHPTEEALADFAWPNTIANDENDLLGFTQAVQAFGARVAPQVFGVR